MLTNSTNLKQTDGGTVIKQGDVSSRFAYQLCDENGDVIQLAGKQAKVSIGNRGELYFSTIVEVSEDNSVSFTLDRALPLGAHQVEVSCDGYIFPSDKSATITVKSSQEQYEVAEPLKKTLSEDDIKRLIAENATGGSSVIYDDTELRETLRALEERPSYDDTALVERVSTLESRGDHDTTYTAGAGLRLLGTEFSVDEASLPQGPKGDTGEQGPIGPQGETGPAGADGKSAYRIWLEHGGVGTEEDFLNSLKATPVVKRRPPTGFSLDRSTTPYQFCFDNGCRLSLGDVDSRAYIHNDGGTVFSETLSEYRVATSVIRTANGSVGIEIWKTANNIARFWADATVVNPINDSSRWNLTSAFYNSSDTNGPSRRSQPNLIKCYFELGVFTESDIMSFGAIKRN